MRSARWMGSEASWRREKSERQNDQATSEKFEDEFRCFLSTKKTCRPRSWITKLLTARSTHERRETKTQAGGRSSATNNNKWGQREPLSGLKCTAQKARRKHASEFRPQFTRIHIEKGREAKMGTSIIDQ